MFSFVLQAAVAVLLAVVVQADQKPPLTSQPSQSPTTSRAVHIENDMRRVARNVGTCADPAEIGSLMSLAVILGIACGFFAMFAFAFLSLAVTWRRRAVRAEWDRTDPVELVEDLRLNDMLTPSGHHLPTVATIQTYGGDHEYVTAPVLRAEDRHADPVAESHSWKPLQRLASTHQAATASSIPRTFGNHSLPPVTSLEHLQSLRSEDLPLSTPLQGMQPVYIGIEPQPALASMEVATPIISPAYTDFPPAVSRGAAPSLQLEETEPSPRTSPVYREPKRQVTHGQASAVPFERSPSLGLRDTYTETIPKALRPISLSLSVNTEAANSSVASNSHYLSPQDSDLSAPVIAGSEASATNTDHDAKSTAQAGNVFQFPERCQLDQETFL